MAKQSYNMAWWIYTCYHGYVTWDEKCKNSDAKLQYINSDLFILHSKADEIQWQIFIDIVTHVITLYQHEMVNIPPKHKCHSIKSTCSWHILGAKFGCHTLGAS